MGHLALGGAALGAVWLGSVPGMIAAVAVGAAIWLRHPALVAVALFAVTSFLGGKALAGLQPADAGPVDGWLTLLDDPRPAGAHGIRFTARFEQRRVAVFAHGPAAGRLDDLLAGEQVHVTGSIRPTRDDDSWARWRHEVGRVTVDGVVDRAPASPVSAFANAIRRTLSGGASGMNATEKAVFLGMVIGDDRAQTAATADDFRAAGLGHLLVVSGQNVAFVLAVVAPVAARLRPGRRLVVLCAVLLMFAVLTRFEPSVMRAVAMAGVGIGAGSLGTPIDGRRGLSWAIAGLLVVDPFLLHVLAFQLSAAATTGIVWLSAPLGRVIPGPSWIRVPFATTVAAQLAVSPLLVLTFGPMPLASLPANLLAGPASGPVMMWGFTAGLAAGVVGGWPATLIHVPTSLMLWWITGVAAAAARAPQATLDFVALATIAAAVAAALIGPRPVRLAAMVVAIAVCATSVASAPRAPAGETLLGDGVELLQADGLAVIILRNPTSPRSVLETIRLAGVGRPVVVVATDGDAADAFAVLALSDRFGELFVIAPPLHRVPGAKTVRMGDDISIAGLVLRVVGVDPELEIAVAGRPPPSIDVGGR